MAKFIILHSKHLKPSTVKLMLNAFKSVGVQILDDKDDIYICEGDMGKVKEIISPLFGEWSITPIKEPEVQNGTGEREGSH